MQDSLSGKDNSLIDTDDAMGANKSQCEDESIQTGIILNSDHEDKFYTKAQEYWSHIPATVNGMLGGLGFVNAVDIKGSVQFLHDLKCHGNETALDCGAGIGRVTKNLLLPRFKTVDLVEQDPIFAEKAREYCMRDLNCSHQIGVIYNVGLQHFTPKSEKYDLIWSQWVLGHLTDEDLESFFLRIRNGLSTNGYFVFKENVTSTKKIEMDDNDSSMTRPLKLYEKILKKTRFRIVKISRQSNFPKCLYPVYMIACQPLRK